MKLRPMLQVSDVAESSRWYQTVLRLRSGHGGDEYEMLFDNDDFVLQLHRLEANEHGLPQAGTSESRVTGFSLWFEVVDRQVFDGVVEQARKVGAPIVSEPGWNPIAHHYEATLVEPDGYRVVIHTPFES